MATIKEAIEYSKVNPNSAFATELRKRIESGQMNAELQQAGLDQYVTAPPPTKQAEPTLGQKLMGRGKTLVSEVTGQPSGDILRKADTTSGKGIVSSGTEAIARAAQAPIRALGAVGGAIGDVVGAGFEATGLDEPIGKAVAPIVQSAPVQKAVETFKKLPQETQDTLKVIVDASNIPLAGISTFLVKKGVQAGVKTAANASEELAKISGKIIEGKDSKILSIFTGEADEVVKKAMEFPEEADLGIQGGDEALRNAVQTGSESSIKAREAFVQAHREAFKQLVSENPGKIVSRQKVLYQFVDDLEKAGVKVKKGKLDFSTSKIVANPGEISKIQATYKAIQNWKDFSLEGMNELKQLVGGLTKFATEAGGSSKSPFLGKYYNFINNEIADSLPDVSKKSYQDMNKKFTDTIDLYDEMVDAFNSGDPFTKIAQIFSSNKDSLRQVVDFYEKITGNKISPIVAGRTLAEAKPAAFGFLNPRQWIDFFIDPKTQASMVTKAGKIKRDSQ